MQPNKMKIKYISTDSLLDCKLDKKYM